MAADAHKLLSHLSHDTAQSVLAWLNSRGKDLPVHIPLSTIRFARECFSIIDADNNGTLEAEELLAVFKALGQPASLRQVTRLVESVAGAGAQSLRFSDFAQAGMMHGAMAERRPGEVNLHSLLQQEVNLGGSGRGDGGGGEEQEAPLNWSDFHLLAKAFRRRVVLDGVINCTEGWREKVAALAERRAASSHAGAVTAASVWRHRVQRLAQAQPASGQGAGTAQGPDAGAEAAAGMLPSTGGGDGGDALCGAISAGPTPRSACGSDIRVDAEEEGRGQDRHALGNSRHQAPDQQAPGISRRQAPGPAGSYGDIFDVYLSGVAAGTPAAAALLARRLLAGP
ncbi:hypothetical protein CHLNCDRAFT_144085 [Chlorella variabilis]|uniref:EF-hand domain-containing protein n=1 Tax=Chlorella variabilis TaxID=554065 RepID=E1ZBV2_CHLVA|nr:hypothetical protein CHLNCDRAFT_144085 [Chlorella variabilis]EFN56707.1 hypothetical protein CHLNCDRAFT_144085 [Chlorella variabilis]|eukprot:XP_005848809.1 hypothetical protein CHLNCDRAFT_144085 [Chlorella variabilis]